MPRNLFVADVPRLDAGTRILGCGGGAPSAVATHLTSRGWAPGEGVRLSPIEALAPEEWVLAVGVIGAGSMYDERPPTGTELLQAVTRMTEHTGVPISGVMCAEIAGMNGLLMVDTARKLHLPVIDADLMGRALPRLSQLSMGVAGLSLTPLVVVMSSGQKVILEGGTRDSVERIVRAMLASSDGWASMALAPLRASDVASVAITGSVTRALSLGGQLFSCHPGTSAEGLAKELGADLLGAGRIVEVSRPTVGSSVELACAVVQGGSGTVLRVDMKSEFLLVLRDGIPVAQTPDIIVLVDRRRTRPMQCDEVHVGADVVLLKLSPPAFWEVPEHRVHVDLGAYGLPSLTGDETHT